MYDHLAADRQKVEIKEEYLLPKAVKAFKKRLKFPAWEIYDYTIPSTNNKYVGREQISRRWDRAVSFKMKSNVISSSGLPEDISTLLINRYR